jgi:carboxyl-terminal processing protease
VAVLLNDSTGYIKSIVLQKQPLKNLKKGKIKDGAKALVIDLRDNGGGYMEEAIDIADELLKTSNYRFTKIKGSIQNICN